MKGPEFDAAYREARRLAFRQSISRLQQASGAAVTTLLKIMVDQTPTWVRMVGEHSAELRIRGDPTTNRCWQGSLDALPA